jgi:hypothetical protein
MKYYHKNVYCISSLKKGQKRSVFPRKKNAMNEKTNMITVFVYMYVTIFYFIFVQFFSHNLGPLNRLAEKIFRIASNFKEASKTLYLIFINNKVATFFLNYTGNEGR